MRQVRQVLGPDALIVSNRSVDGGIEVLATVDGAFDEAAGQAQQPPQQHASQQAPQPATHHAPYQEQTPAVMPPTAYPAPSRPIAAYQSAYAASALPEDEDEAGMMPASAPAAPVRVEIPPLPSAAPVRMEMPPLAPAAPVRMEMPPLQAAPQARAPPCPRCRQWRLTRGLRRRSSSPCRSNTPPPATPPAYRAAPQAQPARNPRPAAGRPLRRPRPCTRLSPRRNRPPRRCRRLPAARRAHGAHARCADAAGTGVAAGDLARRHGRRPAECDQRLARRAGKPHGRPALGRPPGREPAGAALFRSLLDAGFSTKLVRTLVERMPEGWTPTPRWPGRATNWSRTCRCWARRIRS